jgi:hypothetical protein
VGWVAGMIGIGFNFGIAPLFFFSFIGISLVF